MGKCLVFAIEEFSVFDGPGIRTTVFLKGCPLRCVWCHNPEGQSFSNMIVRSPNGCIGCKECERRADVLPDGNRIFNKSSIDGCPRGLLRYCAREYTSEELCAKLESNLNILNRGGGGVTFSGGEPLANNNFLLECLRALRGKTSRAVQTSGYADARDFEKVLEECDYMLFDLKIADPAKHKKYTGATNEPILENLRSLASSGKEFVIRMPLIPGVTDTEDNVRGIAEILLDNGIKYIEVLPYNKLAGAKYPLVGKKYDPDFDTGAEPRLPGDVFGEYGITAVKM